MSTFRRLIASRNPPLARDCEPRQQPVRPKDGIVLNAFRLNAGASTSGQVSVTVAIEAAS
ncbi:hypothetical protein KNE206_53140 [Kitasatospora sp. NE20-6]